MLVLAIDLVTLAITSAAWGLPETQPNNPHMNGMPNMPYIDKDQIPTGFEGYTDLRVIDADQSDPFNWPVPASIGSFGIDCRFSHMNFDDPIVFPGMPGMSHLHAFFGNTGTNAYSTPESLAKTWSSTCNGGIMNRTAYWVPPLVDTRTGVPIAPEDAVIYYQTGFGGIDPADVQPVPPGLRMIAGDPTASGPQEGIWWDCFSPGVDHFATPPVNECVKVGAQYLVATVNFPQCWDGKNLDTPNHKDHLAIPQNRACPEDHPVPIPAITFFVFYGITDDMDPSYLRLSSDMYDWSLPGGASLHGDYMYGWMDEFMETFVQNCENTSLNCHAHLLGDGRMFY